MINSGGFWGIPCPKDQLFSLQEDGRNLKICCKLHVIVLSGLSCDLGPFDFENGKMPFKTAKPQGAGQGFFERFFFGPRCQRYRFFRC